jgi:glycosyltransferase involved in cell wall biosynthesis
MATYATGLVKRGHEVTVLTTDALDSAERAQPPFEILEGVHVHRYRNVSNGLAWRSKKFLPPGLVASALLRSGRFDAVHATDVRTIATASGWLGSRRHHVPFCLSPHGSLPGSAGLRGAVKNAYDRALVRPMLGGAALLLAQTEHEQRLLLEAGAEPDAVRLLPLPLDVQPEIPPRRNGFLRTRLGLTSSHKIVLFLGRIHWLKGVDLLAAALQGTLERDPSYVLVIVGRDDGFTDSLKQQYSTLVSSGQLRISGPLYGDERFSAYADADVFAMTPRHWEETSLAALEAGSSGTPLVVTEQAEIPGLDTAGAGFIVPNERAAIAAAVTSAVERSDEMGAAASRFIREQHGAEAVVDALEGELRGVVEARA